MAFTEKYGRWSLPSAVERPASRTVRRLGVLLLAGLLVCAYLFRDSLSACLLSDRLVLSSSQGDEDWTTLPPGTVKWWPCAGEGGAVDGADCGWIIVPTDYFDPKAGVTRIALGRYNATRERQGLVLVNPGGPGGPGKLMATHAGPMLQAAVTSETWDIVGFDPRGIRETLPRTLCYASPAHEAMLKLNTVLDQGFDVGGNLSDPGLREGLRRGLVQADGIYRTQYALCEKNMGDALRYMSTSTVVRDIDFMTKVLAGEHALINYWGGSYGSILGQYLVNMLPDRIGRVAIDGIADAVAWSNTPNYKWYRQWLGSTEGTYDIFLTACSKAGEWDCPLTLYKGEEPSYIRKRLEKWMDALYEKPLVVDDAEQPGVITAGMARAFLLWTLYIPTSWPKNSKILADALAGEGKLLLQYRDIFAAPDAERQAVSCNDGIPQSPQTAASYDAVLDEYLDVMETQTKLVMAAVMLEPDSGCQYWPVRPPERFAGPWNHTLRNPIVVFSNTVDPITPITSALLVKSLLKDSAILALQDGPGHCTISLPSICNIRKSRAFFEFGVLPEDGHVCEQTTKPFPEEGDYDLLASEERDRLEAGIQLAEMFANLRSY